MEDSLSSKEEYHSPRNINMGLILATFANMKSKAKKEKQQDRIHSKE